MDIHKEHIDIMLKNAEKSSSRISKQYPQDYEQAQDEGPIVEAIIKYLDREYEATHPDVKNKTRKEKVNWIKQLLLNLEQAHNMP